VTLRLGENERKSWSKGGTRVPTVLPIRGKGKKSIVSDTELIAVISIVPWLACLLLVHVFPQVAGAFAMAGQIR
jgi:hypothetical protein